MNKIIATSVVAIALAAGISSASAQHGYGYGYRNASPADSFARQAARDGRITKDEARIINRLRSHEAYGNPYHNSYHRPWYRRWW